MSILNAHVTLCELLVVKKNQAIQTYIQFFHVFFNLMKEKYEVPGSCYQQSFFLRKKNEIIYRL